MQGSSDAMLMAWNMVDALNKKENAISDLYDPVFVIEGVSIPGLTFVDDSLEAIRNVDDLIVSMISNECFERANRVYYKPVKCKLMFMNCEEVNVCLDGVKLDGVDEHGYLGTMVEKNGRKADLTKRVSDCKGVLNETVELCKTSGISIIRLRFVRMLMDVCFKMKFKYGCEVWDKFNGKTRKMVNDLIPDTLKRVMELPGSTPTCAIKHEFGICDMDFEVDMERIVLVQNVYCMDDERVVKRLLVPMFEKQVPGFCTVVKEALGRFNIKLEEGNNVTRNILKKKLVELEKTRLFEEMIKVSKCSMFFANFTF